MYLKTLNPSIKAITVTLAILLLAFVFDPVTPLLYLLWTITVTFLLGAVSFKKWILYFFPFLIIAFGFFWTTVMFAKEPSAAVETIPFLWLDVPTETMFTAISLSLRVLCFSTLSLLFILTTEPTKFILSLMQQLKLPPKLAYGILAGFRFLPMLKDELFIIRSAHRIRGVNRARTLKDYFGQMKRYAIPLLASAIRKAERTAIAMESKGFTGDQNRTFFKEMKVTSKDWFFLFLMVFIFFCISFLSWKLGFFQFYQGEL